MGVKRYLLVALMFVSLMTNAENLFMDLQATCINLWRNKYQDSLPTLK